MPVSNSLEGYVAKAALACHCELSVSSQAKAVIADLVSGVIERMGAHATDMLRRSSKVTVSPDTVKLAARAVLHGGELSRDACAAADRAVGALATCKAKGERGAISARVGLVFPTQRCWRIFLHGAAWRGGDATRVALAAVADTVAKELINDAARQTKRTKDRRTISGADVAAAVGDSEELAALAGPMAAFRTRGGVATVRPAAPAAAAAADADDGEKPKKKRRRRKSPKRKSPKRARKC